MQLENIALLFPGQGSQELNMAKAQAEADPDIMDLWKKAEKASNIALREIYWDEGAAARPEIFDDTRNLQPALVTANLSMWMALSGKVKPACCAGHSLGEYCALAAARALSADEVLKLVSLRGRLMAEADPAGKGGMAAVVKLDQAAAEKAIQEAAARSGAPLRIANYNTPAQFVASGGKKAIEALQETVKELKGRAIPLAVSGAFHSPMMEEASKELARELEKAEWREPDFPVYCNVSGKACRSAAEIREQAMLQMTSSVLWVTIIQEQFKAGARRFLECGPKNVLAKMVGANLKGLAEDGEYEALTFESALAS